MELSWFSSQLRWNSNEITSANGSDIDLVFYLKLPLVVSYNTVSSYSCGWLFSTGHVNEFPLQNFSLEFPETLSQNHVCIVGYSLICPIMM